MIDISILIVNYNTAQLVLECVESLLNQRDVKLEIIVVDNNSQDNSVELLHSHFGSRIGLIANKDNRGFGAANNQAFKHSHGRLLFLLNPDARCLSEYDLARAVEFMNREPRIGLAGTRVVDCSNQLQETVYKHYPKQRQTTTDFSYLPGEIASVLGASMLIRRDAFEKVGGFDEDYFLYAEETDICLRLRKEGYWIGYCDDVTVRHVGGASEKTLPSKQVVTRKKSGKYLFYSKHYSADDLKKIANHDYRLAQKRLLLLRLKKFLRGLTSEEQYEFDRHSVTTEVVKKYC